MNKEIIDLTKYFKLKYFNKNIENDIQNKKERKKSQACIIPYKL